MLYVPNFRNTVAEWCVRIVLPHVSDKAARESYNATLGKLTDRLEALYAEFRKIVPRFFRFYDEFELHSSYQLEEITHQKNYTSKISMTISARNCDLNKLNPMTSWNAIAIGAETPSPKLKPNKK